MGKFVEVVAKTTGKKQRVPAHYLDNPRLMEQFELPPKAKAAGRQAGPPPTPDAPASTDSTTTTTRTTETPAAGDKE